MPSIGGGVGSFRKELIVGCVMHTKGRAEIGSRHRYSPLSIDFPEVAPREHLIILPLQLLLAVRMKWRRMSIIHILVDGAFSRLRIALHLPVRVIQLHPRLNFVLR